MKNGFTIPSGEMDVLRTLIGKTFVSCGTSKPGVDREVAIEEVFIATEGATIECRLVFEPANVCGEIGDYVAFVIKEGSEFPSQSKTARGGSESFAGEIVRAVTVHRAQLVRTTEAAVRSFEHDALIDLTFDTGSLWLFKEDLSTPMIEIFATAASRFDSVLPNPASGWPQTTSDHWEGEWLPDR
jgi:hypothetical protein